MAADEGGLLQGTDRATTICTEPFLNPVNPASGTDSTAAEKEAAKWQNCRTAATQNSLRPPLPPGAESGLKIPGIRCARHPALNESPPLADGERILKYGVTILHKVVWNKATRSSRGVPPDGRTLTRSQSEELNTPHTRKYRKRGKELRRNELALFFRPSQYGEPV